MAGGEDKITGKAKEGFGSVTGDQSKKSEGQAQNLAGKAQGAAKSASDTVGSGLQSAKETVTGSK